MNTNDIDNLSLLAEQVLQEDNSEVEMLEDIIFNINHNPEQVDEDEWVYTFNYFKNQNYTENNIPPKVKEIFTKFYDIFSRGFEDASYTQKNLNQAVAAQFDDVSRETTMDDIMDSNSLYKWARDFLGANSEFFINNKNRISKRKFKDPDMRVKDDFCEDEILEELLDCGIEEYVTFPSFCKYCPKIWSEFSTDSYIDANDFIETAILNIVT